MCISTWLDGTWGWSIELDFKDPQNRKRSPGGYGHRVRKIALEPLGKSDVHSHIHSTKHMVVLSGNCSVFKDGMENLLGPGESVFIPECVQHSVENKGKIPLVYIEVAVGQWFADTDEAYVMGTKAKVARKSRKKEKEQDGKGTEGCAGHDGHSGEPEGNREVLPCNDE